MKVTLLFTLLAALVLSFTPLPAAQAPFLPRVAFTNSLAGGGACSGTSWITGQTIGTATSAFNLEVGVLVAVGASPVTVTHLKRWVTSGNNQTHVLKIRSGAGTLLGSVTVDCNGATPGAFVCGELSSPIVLDASTSYYIYSVETSGGDQWGYSGTTVTTTGVATVTAAGYYDGANNPDAAGQNYGPVGFNYSSP